MLVLRKSDLGLDAKNTAITGHENRLDVAAVFPIVDFSELPPDSSIGDFFRGAFEDDRLIGLIGSNDDVGEGGDIFCFASARTGAEPESVLPPDAPN